MWVEISDYILDLYEIRSLVFCIRLPLSLLVLRRYVAL